MLEKVVIRDVASADFGQWRSLWDQYNAFYGRAGATALSEEIVVSTWNRILHPDEPVHCLVAEYEGDLVGLAHFIFHRNMITIENTCYLQDLFSASAMRDQGIGRGLITELYSRSRQAGASGVYWHTHSTNQTSMRLYDGMATNTNFVVYRKSFASGKA